MAGDKDMLLSMGFEAARVDWALRATSNAGLQSALDFLFAHSDDPIPDASVSSQAAPVGSAAAPMNVDDDDEDAEALRAALGKSVAVVSPGSGKADGEGGSGADADAGEAVGVEARSIRCAECGKIFKNTALANFHAEKSGHDQFEESTEEIKPLTEEEKAQKLAELKAKLEGKRAQKSVVEAEEARVNAAIRRKADREAMDAREELKTKEALKAVEQAKREKADDRRAREEIRRQIEVDKEERRQRQAREKALREGTAVPAPAAPAPAVVTPSAEPGIPAKEYPETRLQIRLASGGKPYVTTLPSESTLREVAEYVAAQTLSVDVETVTFTMSYPRKQFSQADFPKTLRELGLTPSAILLVS